MSNADKKSMRAIHRAFAAILVLVGSLSQTWNTFAQSPSYPLAQVTIGLKRTNGGGCLGPCSRYEITIRGDGTVEYKGESPVAGLRTRRVAVDEVLSVVNEFLRVRFFDALAEYSGLTSLIRAGDTFVMRREMVVDYPRADLTLQIGERSKKVALYHNYPEELGRLPELIDRIGGPQVWLGK